MNNIDTKNPLEREPITTDLVDTKTAIEFQNMQKDEYTDVAHKAWENLIAPHTANQKALAEQVQAAKNAEEKLQNNPYAKDKLVQTLQTKIDTDPALTDADGNKIQELLKQGKYREAIKAGFELISNAIFGGKERKTEIGFPKFRQLDEEVSKLDLGKKSTSELTSLQEYFEGKISDAGSVKRKVSYTYLLSAVKDQVAQRDEKAKSRTEIIEKQLQVGSVILLNKQNAGTGGMLLQDLSENDVDMTHVIVITEMGPPVRFSHATEHKFSNTNRSGVETNVPLWDYLKWNLADVVVLTPDEAHRQKAIAHAANITSDEKYSYSQTAAALGAIGLNDVQRKGGKFNCGTYVQSVLDLDGKDISVPGQFLSDKRLKPTYMATVDMSGS